MIVTAALAWYDEAPEDLVRYVCSLTGFCDRLVAVDGGYERYPGAEMRSSDDEAVAIKFAADTAGIDLDLYLPERIWRGQVEKRSFLYESAAEGSDWVFTLDADHILHGPVEPFRHELEHLSDRFDAVAVPFYTTMNNHRLLSDTASTDWHRKYAGQMINHRLLLRALPGMQVERFHWYVSALKDERRFWLTAVTEGGYPVAEEHILESPFLVEHRCLFRRDRNILANREFCNDRVAIVAASGQEDA